ncbi:hypothetical protein GGF46_000430 [Coemansia sp. RSA 552]|nr:hypothetical protein GGF46_000430 [Coemansia sp. RSA 552]
MTRGNQRDLARAKNQKKLEKQGKGKKDDGRSLAQKKAADAEALQRKQARKAEEKAKAAGQGADHSSDSEAKPKK